MENPNQATIGSEIDSVISSLSKEKTAERTGRDEESRNGDRALGVSLGMLTKPQLQGFRGYTCGGGGVGDFEIGKDSSL